MTSIMNCSYQNVCSRYSEYALNCVFPSKCEIRKQYESRHKLLPVGVSDADRTLVKNYSQSFASAFMTDAPSAPLVNDFSDGERQDKSINTTLAPVVSDLDEITGCGSLL
jgi:hypothetical protein